MLNPEVQSTGVGQEKKMEDTEPIFALDIGTRSIIGIVGFQEGNLFKVLASETAEHAKRAMIDGQIEDIDQTAQTVSVVVERLKEKTGINLKQVCVAAAGRALKTQKASYEIELEAKEPISSQVIFDLEMSAIQQAHDAIIAQGDDEEATLCCVGFSVIKYYLDDYAISTLLNHRGKKAKVEIIATFLPNEVVESLYATMARIQLTVSSITLEPIAAMNAIIPKELRMLNLALVDIGAGTSDIAISNDGSVTAYTMATVAGDEVTEAIIRAYLVDFETAERIKLELSKGTRSIEYKDILGFSHNLSSEELLETITPTVENLCEVICQHILSVNEKAPAAVFLVGGGSQIPLMRALVAKYLAIEENKVAVGGNNYMKRMVDAEQDISGPEYATPMGIAITAMTSRERDSFAVSVNDKKLRMFKSSAMTVMDALLMSGYQHNQIIGRSGKSVTIELNQQKKTIRGGYPVSAVIEVNGKSASISTPVRSGDKITVQAAVPGSDAVPVVQDVVESWKQIQIKLNGLQLTAGTTVLVNGLPAGRDQRIYNLDVVQVYDVVRLSDLCREAKIKLEEFQFLVNGDRQTGDYVLREGDDVRYFAASSQKMQADRFVQEPRTQTPVQAVDDLDETENQTQKNDQPITITLNRREVELYPKADHSPYLFVDMLNFVDIDPSKPQGNIFLGINGREASYLDLVSDGDVIEIYWDKTQTGNLS